MLALLRQREKNVNQSPFPLIERLKLEYVLGQYVSTVHAILSLTIYCVFLCVFNALASPATTLLIIPLNLLYPVEYGLCN